MSAAASPFGRRSPAQRQADAEDLVRKCLIGFGQPVDEAVVQQQAAKIVRSMSETLGMREGTAQTGAPRRRSKAMDSGILSGAVIVPTADQSRPALEAVDSMSLVIESAVRNADPGNYDQTLAALRLVRTALAAGCAEPGAAKPEEREDRYLRANRESVEAFERDHPQTQSAGAHSPGPDLEHDPRAGRVASALEGMAKPGDAARLARILLYIADSNDPLRRTAADVHDKRGSFHAG